MVRWMPLEPLAAAVSHISPPLAPFHPMAFRLFFSESSRHAFHQTLGMLSLPLPRAHPPPHQGIVFIGMEGEGSNAKFNVSDEAMEFLETVRR